jgi:O-antigen/teichoic acid export membrane protein
MTDQSFWAAAWLVPLTALSRLMSGIYFMAGTGIELSDDTRPYPFISGIGLVTLVVSTSLVVPEFGAAGAALCNSLATLVTAVLARRVAKTRYAIDYDWPLIASLTAVAFVCGAVWYVFRAEPLAVRLVVAAAATLAYPAAAAVLLHRAYRSEARLRPPRNDIGLLPPRAGIAMHDVAERT